MASFSSARPFFFCLWLSSLNCTRRRDACIGSYAIRTPWLLLWTASVLRRTFACCLSSFLSLFTFSLVRSFFVLFAVRACAPIMFFVCFFVLFGTKKKVSRLGYLSLPAGFWYLDVGIPPEVAFSFFLVLSRSRSLHLSLSYLLFLYVCVCLRACICFVFGALGRTCITSSTRVRT